VAAITSAENPLNSAYPTLAKAMTQAISRCGILAKNPGAAPINNADPATNP
jgi:hypothetical protein